MAPRTAVALTLALLLGAGAGAPAQPGDDAAALVAQLSRLSLDLRSAPLDPAERRAAVERLRGASLDRIYRDHLDAWLDPSRNADFYRRLLAPWLPPGPLPQFLPLSSHRDEAGRDVLYLPGHHASTPPCATAETVLVRPWWRAAPVRICADSYRKDVTFVGARYCPLNPTMGGGYMTPDECGCGPRLMHCVPPPEVDPEIHAALAGIEAEYAETAFDLAVRRGRPLAELFTTSRTWQNGLVQFLYARRETARLLAGGKQLTPAIERQIDRILARVDARSAPRWVERTGPYRGTGVLLTVPGAISDTYRNQIRGAFGALVCEEFQSTSVDRDAFLETVGHQHANLRELDAIVDSPMRHQAGCEGCHMPMDTSVAFVVGMELPWRGGFPRAAAGAPVELYLRGAGDRRGHARGIAGFMRLMTEQPEFEACVVEQAFQAVMQRFPLASERAMVDELQRDLALSGQSLPRLIRQLFLADAYRSGR